jgi:hypothetical protein
MTWTEKALNMRPYMEKAAASLSDADALQVPTMFPKWATDTAYAVGERTEYNGTLYRVVQAHTSQSDWTPNVTPALWVAVSLDEYPQWVQPTGSHDAYNVGDKVAYNEKKWVSAVDGNVWEPGIYGWDEVM